MSSRARTLNLLRCALLLTPAGCRKAAPSADAPAPVAANAALAPTEEEARQFADQLAAVARARNAGEFNRLVRMQELIERIANSLNLSAAEKKDFLEGA